MDVEKEINQQLFVNSYQSKLWNEVALERYELSPTKVRINDLVLVDKRGKPLTAWHTAERNIIMNANSIFSYSNKFENCASEKYFYKKLTDKDNLTGYPIESVILPMPGYGMEADCLPQTMKIRIEMDDMNVLLSKEQKSTAFRIPGAFRHLLSKPENVRYRQCTGDRRNEEAYQICNDKGNQLKEYKLPAQVEIFMKEGDNRLNEITGRVSTWDHAKADAKDNDNGYIQICFSLCSSTYATTYIEYLFSRLDVI